MKNAGARGIPWLISHSTKKVLEKHSITKMNPRTWGRDSKHMLEWSEMAMGRLLNQMLQEGWAVRLERWKSGFGMESVTGSSTEPNANTGEKILQQFFLKLYLIYTRLTLTEGLNVKANTEMDHQKRVNDLEKISSVSKL